ncbi:CDP-alcohol phosphatidyltransferase family protein [Pseudomonadales bacterium]|nr:CDP-alcohol phosphatidyltransferase family protein [Pseudomonadales bacterium]
MIDSSIRHRIDPAFNAIGKTLSSMGITANQVTIAGFALGMMALPLLAFEMYYSALFMGTLNRVCDALDGAIARDQGITDVGGYLDIVLDFIFYSAVVFGFILAQPEQAVYGAFLIFSFIGSGTSFLAYSIFAAKNNLTTEARGIKSIYYLGGLTEGFETIITFILMCLLPAYFWLIAAIFSTLCWISTATRIHRAMTTL